MIKLIVLKKDGSLYWSDHFEDQESAQKWIDEEQTRSYWDKENTYSFEEIQVGPTAEAIAEMEQSNNDRASAIDKISKLAKLTPGEITALFGR